MAVVAAGHGLQHGRIMNLVEGGVKLIEVVDSAPRCGGGAVVVDELLLVHAVLGHAQQVGACGVAVMPRTSSMAPASTFSNS